MKVLIAIKGCERDAMHGVHQASRDTWLRELSWATDAINARQSWREYAKNGEIITVDYRFFIGNPGAVHYEVKSDEVRLNCPDDYQGLPHKTRTIAQWSNGYDFIYLCDTDTLVIPDRLLGSGFQHWDYFGGFNGDGQVGEKVVNGKYSWASGGPGYWLSAKAARFVALASPDDWAEDRWVGNVLGPHIQGGFIRAQHSKRYYWGRNGAHEVIDICLHYSSEGSHRPFNKQWMYDWWKELRQL